MKTRGLLLLLVVALLSAAAFSAAWGGQVATDETSVWGKDDAGLAGGAGKRAKFINSVRERTSLTNQLTPQNSVKRVVTPHTTFVIDKARPPLPQPSAAQSTPAPAGSVPVQAAPR